MELLPFSLPLPLRLRIFPSTLGQSSFRAFPGLHASDDTGLVKAAEWQSGIFRPSCSESKRIPERLSCSRQAIAAREAINPDSVDLRARFHLLNTELSFRPDDTQQTAPSVTVTQSKLLQPQTNVSTPSRCFVSTVLTCVLLCCLILMV